MNSVTSAIGSFVAFFRGIHFISTSSLVVLILPLTESHLKRHYTKSGSPKSVVDEFDLPPTGVTSSEEE